MATAYDRRNWISHHKANRYKLTSSALPYPKPSSARNEAGQVRPAYALYAFVVAHAGKRVEELTAEADNLVRASRDRKIDAYSGKAAVESAIRQVGGDIPVEEVLKVVAEHHPRHLRSVQDELAWCYQHGWVGLDPSPEFEP